MITGEAAVLAVLRLAMRMLLQKPLEQGQCDVLMHRYNLADRKAEEAVLPAARSTSTPVAILLG
jgi:aryl-alcohol dehydrogenase-like predicted oxidoreductase